MLPHEVFRNLVNFLHYPEFWIRSLLPQSWIIYEWFCTLVYLGMTRLAASSSTTYMYVLLLQNAVLELWLANSEFHILVAHICVCPISYAQALTSHTLILLHDAWARSYELKSVKSTGDGLIVGVHAFYFFVNDHWFM